MILFAELGEVLKVLPEDSFLLGNHLHAFTRTFINTPKSSKGQLCFNTHILMMEKVACVPLHLISKLCRLCVTIKKVQTVILPKNFVYFLS